ncbi:hypothetical protein C8R45DRAFT_945910 [Mycena sanguinolenta]|nr:hypothetical protein C8R45DRAFT_945910 [Mycena sanguinolenta]
MSTPPQILDHHARTDKWDVTHAEYDGKHVEKATKARMRKRCWEVMPVRTNGSYELENTEQFTRVPIAVMPVWTNVMSPTQSNASSSVLWDMSTQSQIVETYKVRMDKCDLTNNLWLVSPYQVSNSQVRKLENTDGQPLNEVVMPVWKNAVSPPHSSDIRKSFVGDEGSKPSAGIRSGMCFLLLSSVRPGFRIHVPPGDHRLLANVKSRKLELAHMDERMNPRVCFLLPTIPCTSKLPVWRKLEKLRGQFEPSHKWGSNARKDK